MIAKKIAVIGIGYVGLPLAIEFGKKFETVAYDNSKYRIDTLKKGNDYTLEFNKNYIKSSKKLFFSHKVNDIKNCNIYIITVPTPIFKNKKPDLRPLKEASKQVGKILKINDIVIYESTVYPGLTEEFCVPILKKFSNLSANKDFFYGYSPERINPGDKKHQLKNVIKVVSGSTYDATLKIKKLYSSIIRAGICVAKDIKTAEAAKVIENIQRDINVGFVNELFQIFDKMNIDTHEVLKAACTKWNFLNFKPGLVGGHCIGVDPYYLLEKVKKTKFNAKLITAGREINDQMGYFYSKLIHKKIKKIFLNKKINILILGYTFKENCSDTRNTKVFDLYSYFFKKKYKVDIHDPWVRSFVKYIKLKKKIKKNFYDCIIVAVPHKKFKLLGKSGILKFAKKTHVYFDIKNEII